jgi:hypothetical protein
MLCLFIKLAISACLTRFPASSDNAVVLTDTNFDSCSTAVVIAGEAAIAMISACHFLSCTSETDNAAVSFAGLGLTASECSFHQCEARHSCPALGATKLSTDPSPPWIFRDSTVHGSRCASATCRFTGISPSTDALHTQDVNFTSNLAAVCGSIFCAKNISARLAFCRLESNGDHNGLLLRGVPATFRFAVFAFNHCARTPRSSIQGFFDADSASTLRSCLFYRNSVECWSGPRRPLLTFDRCTWDADFGASPVFLTVNCTVRKIAAAEVLAPWVTRTWFSSAARTGTPATRPTGLGFYSKGKEEGGLSGWAIALIVILVLGIGAGGSGGGYVLVTVNAAGEVTDVREVRD